jgi:aryl-alcohol dehydrogenase-like predicted oxidoreductase
MKPRLDVFAPRRKLGRTGFEATALGAGDLADRRIPKADCVATLRRALDAGLNVMDTAPGYEQGYSEEIVGAALQDRRDGVFLIDKIDSLREPVAPQVEASLARLNLPLADAFVFHAVSSMDDWRHVAAPGGGMDQLEAERNAGRTRFRGISSHSPAVLSAAMDDGRCDILMFPVGPFVDERYERDILPRARAAGVGTVCFKTFGAGKLLADTIGYNQPLAQRPRGKISSGGQEMRPTLPRLGVEECVHYTLTLDPDVALLGLSFPGEQDAAFAAARSFRKLAPETLADIRRRAAIAIRHKGDVWWNPAPGR